MLVNLLYALVPYLMVGMGLLVFHNAWAAILLYHGAILFAVAISKRTVPFKQIIRGSGSALMIFSAAIGAIGGLLIYLLWPVLSVPPDINSYMQGIGLTSASWPCFIAYYVLVNPVFEEYYWRGYLGSGSKYPVMNDFMFAGYHLLVLGGKVDAWWLVIVFAVLGGAGWYWRQISRVSGGLFAATLSHMAADLTVILAIYWMTIKA